MRYVFDTNVLIDALRLKKDGSNLVSAFEDSTDELYISSVVGFELFSGQSSVDKTQQKHIRAFLEYFEVMDVSWNIARRAGEIYRSGIRTLEFPDYIIAATALEIGAEIITLNRKHFLQIPGVRIFEF